MNKGILVRKKCLIAAPLFLAVLSIDALSASWGGAWGYYNPDKPQDMVAYNALLASCGGNEDYNCATSEKDGNNGVTFLIINVDIDSSRDSDCASHSECRGPQKNKSCPASANPIVYGTGRKYLSEDDVPSSAMDRAGFVRHYNYLPANSAPPKSYRELWGIDLSAGGTTASVYGTESYIGYNSNVHNGIDLEANRRINKLDALEQLISTQTSSATGTPYRLIAMHFSMEYLSLRLDGLSYFATIEAGQTGTTDDPDANFTIEKIEQSYVNGQLSQDYTYRLTKKDGTIYNYGLHGQLLNTVFPNGNDIVYTYTANSFGYMDRTIIDSFGKTLTFTYTSADHIELTDSQGQTFHYIFDSPTDPNPRLKVIYPDDTPGTLADNDYYEYEHISAFDANGDPTQLNGALKSIYKNGQLYISYQYDAVNGYPTVSEMPGGKERIDLAYVLDAVYPQRVLSTTVTNALGKDTKYHYTHSSNGNAPQPLLTQVEGISSANCAATNSSYTYDANGYVATHTDENGNVTQFTHDANGRELSRTEAFGTPQVRTITTEWHATWEKPTKIIEPNRTVEFTYDAAGNQLTETIKP